MLRNCKVARILPRIAEIAKSDKSSVLRARFVFILQLFLSSDNSIAQIIDIPDAATMHF